MSRVFEVYDKQLKRYVKSPYDRQIMRIAKKAKLMTCDMEGFALGQTGELFLMDECGGMTDLDTRRFEVRIIKGSTPLIEYES